MIYDPHLGLIFIKTLKVSGSSFEAALIPLLSDRAIATINENWTSDGQKIDAIRHRRTTWLPLRRLIPQIFRHRREALHIPADFLKRRGPRHEAFSLEKDHMSAEEIRSVVGTDEWNRCIKVEIARNPYDRIVSYYFMKKAQSVNPNRFPAFKDWLVSNPEAILKNERLVSVTNDDGNARAEIDFVLYYEHMEDSLRSFADLFHLDADSLIKRYNSMAIHADYRPRGPEGAVSHVVDPQSKNLIDALLKMRFDRLGYSQETTNIVPLHGISQRSWRRLPSRAVS